MNPEIIDDFASGLSDDVHKYMFDRFVSRAGICRGDRALIEGERIDAEQLRQSAYSFLGYYMVKSFSVMDYLEDAGLWTPEGHDEDDEDALQEEEADEEQLELRHLGNLYRAAGLVVGAFLRYLQSRGCFTAQELAPALQIADTAAKQLVECALLAKYLPGPLQSCIDVVMAASLPLDSERDVAYTASMVQSRFGELSQPGEGEAGFDYRGKLQEVRHKGLKVVRAENKRMHVMEIDEMRVRFTTCLQGSSKWDEPESGVWVEFDDATARLMRRGLIITGCYSQLSDGSWSLSQPGYVWPSFYCCEEACPGCWPGQKQQQQQAEA